MGLLDRLRQPPGEPLPAHATVLWIVAAGPTHLLRVRVRPEGGDSYELEQELVIPQERLPAVGDTLRVTVSPIDPTRIDFGWGAGSSGRSL